MHTTLTNGTAIAVSREASSAGTVFLTFRAVATASVVATFYAAHVRVAELAALGISASDFAGILAMAR